MSICLNELNGDDAGDNDDDGGGGDDDDDVDDDECADLLLFITPVKEDMFSLALACLLVSKITQKLLNRFSQSSMEKWHRFCGNPDHVTVGSVCGMFVVTVR